MARIEQAVNFDVGPEWQDTTPDPSGISAFDRWRGQISVWASLAASARTPLSPQEVVPGLVWDFDGFSTHFHDKELVIYRGSSLLARLPIHYNDDPPPPQGWAFTGRSRQTL